MHDVIRFYSVADPYGEFSNFARYPIRLDGEIWRTNEHCFQAMKFEDAIHRAMVRRAKMPEIAARLGRNRSRKIRRDWASARLRVMRRVVLAKFEQHADLRELLLSTGDATLVEHTARDDFWGDGGDGHGANWLGRILMETRAQLRSDEALSDQAAS